MLIIGLTGSIATGKSTVSSLLSKPPYDLPIIDADLLARQVVEPGTSGYQAIISHFGSSILLSEESSSSSSSSTKPRPIDRAALGRLVFSSNPTAQRNRLILNSIVHPRVRFRMVLAVFRAYLSGHWAVVLDVPLLFESGLDVFCGSVLVVGVSDQEEQLRRLLARDARNGGNLTETEARGRVESQGGVKWKVSRVNARKESMGEKAAEAVWNDGPREELERNVAGVVGRWRRASPRWWCWLLWGLPPLAFSMAFWWFVRGWWVRRQCLGRERVEEKKK